MANYFRKAIIFGAAFFGVFGFNSMTIAQVAATSGRAPVAEMIPSAKDFATVGNRDFTISPDGQKLAFITGEGKDARVVIGNVSTGESQNVNLGGAVKPRGIEWAGDGYLLIHASYPLSDQYKKSEFENEYNYEMRRTASYSLANKTMKLMMPNSDLEYNTNLIIKHVSHENPTDIIMGALEGSNPIYGLYRVSLLTGKGPVFLTGNSFTDSYILDPAGNPRLRYDSKSKEKTISIFKLAGREWVKFLEFTDTIEMPFTIEGFLDDENLLILKKENGSFRPKKLSISSGQIVPLFEEETKSISHIIMDHYDHRPIAISYDSFEPQMKWLSPQMEKAQKSLNSAFPGQYVYITDWDKEKKHLVVSVEGGDYPDQTYLFDADTAQAIELSKPPASFDNYELPIKTIEKMAASDGLEISVLVTRPQNSDGRKMPAIIMPHGGPQSRDGLGYDYIAQFLVSRGYVVIQPQFRGSTGFGYVFEEKGRGEWSGKMQSDVDETVKWAADKGWIDKNRVCILGASYGGYSALVGVSKTPDLYKCAASFGGVFNLGSLQARALERGGHNSSSLAYWREHIGATNYEGDRIRALSPIYQAQNIRVPVLLMHGVHDTVVPVMQSKDMAAALRRTGKTVQYIEFEREDHWLSRQETRERFLVEIEKFLGPILKPE